MPCESSMQYWLTPKDKYDDLYSEFHFDFDPCPYPKTFDGLTVDWGKSNYVNPPFKSGITAWVRKAIDENRKGKTVVIVFPNPGWEHLLVKAGAEIRSLGRWDWVSTKDPTKTSPGGYPIMAFILRGD